MIHRTSLSAILLVLSILPLAEAKTLGQILAENQGKIPTPFSKLMEASGGSESNAVLIPRGRSLVQESTD